jgi:predicted nucleic acid-binding protein
MNMATLVDNSVPVDVAARDPAFMKWSRSALARAEDTGPLVINPVIVAEFSVRYVSLDEADTLLPREHFIREALPWPAAFAAGVAFRRCRASDGERDCVLPDFLIGAHAMIRDYQILTRDAKGCRS